MGNDLHCIRPSYEKAPRLPHNRFKVRNVNEAGQVIYKGYLEVSKNELILYVMNAEPIRWPLRCLRRYGYDANLFSFESGRRCATGPGIYAFRSKHASQIFQLVQESAQNPSENPASPTFPSPSSPTSLMLPAPAGESAATMRQRSFSSDAAPAPNHPASRSSSRSSSINRNFSSHQSLGSNPLPSPSAPLPTAPSPLYFNGTGSIGNCSLRLSPVTPTPTMQYVNSSAFGDIPESPLEAFPPSNSGFGERAESGDRNRDSFGDPSLNYARLKLPMDEDNTNTETCLRREEETESESQREEQGKERIEDEKKKEEDVVVTDGCSQEVKGQSGDYVNDEELEPMKGVEDSAASAMRIDSQSKDDEERWPSVGEEGIDEDGEKSEMKDSWEESDSNADRSPDEESTESPMSEVPTETLIDLSDDAPVGNPQESDVGENATKSSDADKTALLQDVVNGNVRPEKLKDRSGDLESQYNILVNYANLTEQQIQDVLHKLETNRYDNISPCTVCSNSSSCASQRVSPLSYYANLDTAGELPPNWQANGFQFYPELRTPRSTSSKGSNGSEFTFDVNRGSCSPVDHSYANLDTLSEVPPLRQSLSCSAGIGGGGWMILQPPPKGKVNYIQLEFDENDQPILHPGRPLQRSVSSSASTTPPKTPVSPQQDCGASASASASGAKSDIYARIDIEKTVALANSHRQVEGDTDVSTRRTRHDVWADNKRP